jgi:predicted small lipoprotein YifL
MRIRDSIYALGQAAALLLLAGCGSREPLRPPPGQSMPIAPATASRAPTTEELLTPRPIERPDRVGERLRRSEVREDDRFDLPPP